MQLFSLFKEKINLHSKKYHLIGKIDCLGFNNLYLKELRDILIRERKINRQLKKEVKKLSKAIDLELVNEQLGNIEITTRKQLDILNMIRLGVLRKTSYKKFKDACRKEVEQSKFFSKILKETMTNLEGMEAPEKEEIKEDNLLLRQAQQAYKELIRAIGDVKKVRQKAKEIMLINERLKKTNIYGYVKNDMDYIMSKTMYALKHPKESKLKCVLAGAYIIAPLTFEMTGIYLFFRYSRKYVEEVMLKKKAA